MAPRILQAVDGAHAEGIWSVSWSGGYLATGANDDTVRVWSVTASGSSGGHVKPVHTLTGHELGVASVSLSRPAANANGDAVLVSSSLDSQVRVWNAKTGESIGTVPTGPLESWGAAVSPGAYCTQDGAVSGGSMVATGTHDGRVLLHGCTPPFAPLPSESSGGIPTGSQRFAMALAFSPDGRSIACGTAGGGVVVIDAERAARGDAEADPASVVTTLHSHAKRVRGVHFSSSLSLVISCGDDGRTMLHDPRDGSGPVGSVTGHAGWVTGVTAGWSQSCSEFVTCGADGTVRVWDAGTRAPLGVVGEHSGIVWGVAASEDGGMVASVGDDGRLVVYENVRS